MTSSDRDALRREIESLRTKIQKLLGSTASSARGLNEENTKAGLIAPLLAALGWDPRDTEEVHYEYRRRSKDTPVDFALMIQRTPCLFVEAKCCGADLSDRRWTNQVISYSTQAGVGWVVLTNGVDFHLYNANAPVPLEAKLFKKVSLVETPIEEAVAALSLISKADFLGKRIDRAWDAHHVDTQVREVLSRLLSQGEPHPAMVRLVSKTAGGTLSPAEARASLQRARIHVDFPPAPIAAQDGGDSTATAAGAKLRSEAARKAWQTRRSDAPGGSGAAAAPDLRDLLARGILRPPVELVAEFRGHNLKATITADGRVHLDGKAYDSLSTAAGMARLPHFEGDLKGQACPPTNGWKFWKVKDPERRGGDGDLVQLDVLRRRATAR